MNMIFMRFPEGRSKALTLSYDDGVKQDIRLVGILNKYGIKCTFNINSGLCSQGDRLTEEQALKLYSDGGHETAIHTYTHPWIADIPSANIVYEVIEDRKRLEELFRRPIRGMAYPYGSVSDETVKILASCGIAYSRTTESTERFSMPKNWLTLPATCHHNNPHLTELTDKFLSLDVQHHPQMFYMWGHSYEFDTHNNWNVIEDFCEKMSGRDDIWYATNIEIYDYEQAYKRLIWSLDYRFVTNPSAIPVWFRIRTQTKEPRIIKIEAGQTLEL